MYLLARQHCRSIDLDMSIRQPYTHTKPDLTLSFPYNTQQKLKIKHLLYLELISLHKGFFRFESSASKRKRTYLSKGALCKVRGYHLEYFSYTLAKFYVSAIKDLTTYGSNPGIIESDAFDVLQRNNLYVKGLRWRSSNPKSSLLYSYHQ